LWVKRPAMVITSILVGKSVFTVLFVVLSLALARTLLTQAEVDRWGIYLVVIAATFVLLTFAEVLPKAVAKRYFPAVASVSIRLIRVPYFLFFPVTWLYAELTHLIFKKVGGNHSPYPITFDEIEY